jgi:hypothetical protein
MATKFNKIFSGKQLRQVVERRVNRCFENHLCPRHQLPDDEDREGNRNFGLLAIRPPDAADRRRIFVEFSATLLPVAL